MRVKAGCSLTLHTPCEQVQVTSGAGHDPVKTGVAEPCLVLAGLWAQEAPSQLSLHR